MADNVRAVIFNNDQQFLIVTEVDDPDNWKLPGGKLEADEDPKEGIIRELQEELNLTPRQSKLPFVELVTDDGLSKRYIFKIIAPKEQINPTGSEIAQIMWCTVGTVPDCQNKNHILAAVKSLSVI